MILFDMLDEIYIRRGFCLTFIPLTLKVEIDWDMECFFRVEGGDVIEEMVIEFEEGGKGEIAVIPVTVVCVIIIL
jgi:hypothetical protein